MDHKTQIWEAIRNREEEAFRTLYFQCYDSLFKFGIQKLKGDQTKVTSFIDEIFAELWEKGPSLPSVENVEGYLFIIFKRKIFHHLKQKKIFQPVSDAFLEKEMEVELPYEKLLIQMQTTEELKTKIAHALKVLTPRQLEFVRLKYFEELSIKEIAYKQDVTPRTVYNTLHAALKILRKELEGYL